MKIFHWCIFLTSMTSLYSIKNDLRQRHCVAVKTDMFDSCTRKNRPYRDLLPRRSFNNVTCRNNDICHANISVTYIRRQLYTLHIVNRLAEMLDSCCGKNCTSLHIRHKIYRLSAITDTVLNTSDIIFPIMGKRTVKDMYGFYYIPIHDVPSAYYLTLGPTKSEKVLELLLSLFKMWPLIVICLVFSFFAGVVIWLFERKLNRAEFPMDLHEGIYEGFWWSFISMTTVGYGDKSPRTCPGRFFAIFWILIGITIFSILTGSLTNQITTIETLGPQELLGKRVGGLNHRFHDATMVAQHKGFFKGIHYTKTVDGVNDLINKLKAKEIDGFLLNRVSYYYYRLMINKTKKYKKHKENFKQVHLHKTEKDFIGERVCIGMLVKDFDMYEYFRKYFEDNTMQIENCNAFYLSNRATLWEGDDSADDNIDGYGYTFLIVVIVLLVLIGISTLVTVSRRKKKRSQMDDSTRENIILKEREAPMAL